MALIATSVKTITGFQSSQTLLSSSQSTKRKQNLLIGKENPFTTKIESNHGIKNTKTELYVTPLTMSAAEVATAAATTSLASTTASSTLMSNSITSSLIQLGSPIGSLFVLAFIILIHEMGHFLAARSLGMAVEEFSIGFGPRVTGFVQKTLSKSNEKEDQQEENIEFNLRLLPLGGYVRFPENYNRTLAFENEMKMQEYEKALKKYNEEQGIVDVEKAEQSNTILSKLFSRKKEMTTTAQAVSTTKEEKSNIFSIFSNKPKTPKPPQKPTNTDIIYSTDPNLLQNRPWLQKALVLSGGVIFNILLAFTLFFGEMNLGGGLPKPYYNAGALISEQPIQSGASFNILKKGDVITSINGQSLTISNHYSNAETQKSISELISTIRSTQDGDYLNLVIQRNINAKQEPQILDIKIQPTHMLDKENNPTGPQSLGIVLSPNFIKTDLVKATSIPDAIGKSSEIVLDLTKETATSLGTFLSSIVLGNNGGSSTTSLSGPIGVIRTGSEIVKSTDVNALIFFAAAISINLAVVNSLPFPGLDGGQMVFVLAEAVAGRKIDQRLQEEINGYALFVLLLLSLSTTVGDIGSILF